MHVGSKAVIKKNPSKGKYVSDTLLFETTIQGI